MLLDTISDTLYGTKGFKVEILILTGSENKNYKFFDVYHNRVNHKRNAKLNTGFSKMIVFTREDWDSESRSKRQQRYVVPSKLFHDLEHSLNVCEKWMKSKEFSHLFMHMADGSMKLGTPPSFIPTIVRPDNTVLKFTPDIVVDRVTNNQIEGVALFTDKFPFIKLPFNEFLAMSNSVKSFLSNTYGNTLQLISTASLLHKLS